MNFSRGELAKTSTVYNLIGLFLLFQCIRAADRSRSKEAKLLLFHRWLARYHEVHRNRVWFEGRERLKVIPAGASVIWAVYPHSALWFDIGHSLMDARIRPAVDHENFKNHWMAKALGWSRFTDDLDFPHVVRGSGEGSVGSDPYAATFARGLQPSVFFQAGRVPRAYLENGSLDRPGFYSNLVDRHDFSKYAKRGLVHSAIQAARQAGRPAYIPLLRIVGSERSQPKIARHPPFIQPNTTEQTITYRLEDVLAVLPGDEVDTVWTRLLGRAKEAMGIDRYLAESVERWAESLGVGISRESFLEEGRRDERLFIIADRIRSLPPRLTARKIFQDRLVRNAVDLDETSRFSLLNDASILLKQVEYKA